MGQIFNKAFAGLLYVVGAYVALVTVWLVILTIATAFGFETSRDKQEREQRRAFYDGHKQLFCKKAGISPLSAHCTQVFNESAYKKSLVSELARVKNVQDKEVAKNTPFWRRIYGLLISPFR